MLIYISCMLHIDFKMSVCIRNQQSIGGLMAVNLMYDDTLCMNKIFNNLLVAIHGCLLYRVRNDFLFYKIDTINYIIY